MNNKNYLRFLSPVYLLLGLAALGLNLLLLRACRRG